MTNRHEQHDARQEVDTPGATVDEPVTAPASGDEPDRSGAAAEAPPEDHTDGHTDGQSSPAGAHTDLEEMDLDALADADPRSRAELLGELVSAESKRDEYLDDLRRSHADFENYRRRVLREGAAQREAGKGDIATPLLEVLDDLDRTLAAADESEDADLAKGISLVASKLSSTLERAGLERVDATGVAFDPTVHEAVQQQPADEPRDEPTVVEVLRPGYRLGERTLRPAMVVVEQ